jgi:hypothetical protein
MDRLMSNSHLHAERKRLYQALCHRLCQHRSADSNIRRARGVDMAPRSCSDRWALRTRALSTRVLWVTSSGARRKIPGLMRLANCLCTTPPGASRGALAKSQRHSWHRPLIQTRLTDRFRRADGAPRTKTRHRATASRDRSRAGLAGPALVHLRIVVHRMGQQYWVIGIEVS